MATPVSRRGGRGVPSSPRTGHFVGTRHMLTIVGFGEPLSIRSRIGLNRTKWGYMPRAPPARALRPMWPRATWRAFFSAGNFAAANSPWSIFPRFCLRAGKSRLSRDRDAGALELVEQLLPDVTVGAPRAREGCASQAACVVARGSANALITTCALAASMCFSAFASRSSRWGSDGSSPFRAVTMQPVRRARHRESFIKTTSNHLRGGFYTSQARAVNIELRVRAEQRGGGKQNDCRLLAFSMRA